MKSVDMNDALINHNTLYIIGNGFDMHHNLHTGTSDYYKLLWYNISIVLTADYSGDRLCLFLYNKKVMD